MTDDHATRPVTHPRPPAGAVPDDPFDVDPDSEPGDDLQHWLEAEEALRQRRSHLVDFGLPPSLAERKDR